MTPARRVRPRTDGMISQSKQTGEPALGDDGGARAPEGRGCAPFDASRGMSLAASLAASRVASLAASRVASRVASLVASRVTSLAGAPLRVETRDHALRRLSPP